MLDVRERKKAWRRLAVDMFALVSRDERRRLDQILAERMMEYAVRKGAKFLLGFAPMTDEPDLSLFFRHWLHDGGRLAMPVWEGGCDMLLRSVDNLDVQLRPGRGGILEPTPDRPGVAEDELDLVITPGRFFSENCARMGRGSGCYDALFRRRGVANIGVAYDFQVFPTLPTYEGDVPVDVVITPTRIIGEEERRAATACKESEM